METKKQTLLRQEQYARALSRDLPGNKAAQQYLAQRAWMAANHDTIPPLSCAALKAAMQS